jgi:hypothetical protein
VPRENSVSLYNNFITFGFTTPPPLPFVALTIPSENVKSQLRTQLQQAYPTVWDTCTSEFTHVVVLPEGVAIHKHEHDGVTLFA